MKDDKVIVETQKERLADLELFIKGVSEASQGIVPRADGSGGSTSFEQWMLLRFGHTQEDILTIVKEGGAHQKRRLSNTFFAANSIYRRIIAHYTNILKYSAILVPQVLEEGKSLKEKYLLTRYEKALRFIETSNLKTFWAEVTTEVLRHGAYFGVVTENSKKFSTIHLPIDYCRTRFKDLSNNDIIEFNLRYFETNFKDPQEMSAVLSLYPQIIQDAYVDYSRAKGDSWVKLPPEIGFYFFLLDDTPFFIGAIPAIVDYDETIDNEKKRLKEEIRKILVQRIPHFDNGDFLFEFIEAKELHRALVNMMKDNPNISILTTYNDVEAIRSDTMSDVAKNQILESMAQNIHQQTGVSSQIFAAQNSQALKLSLTNDTLLMMLLADQYSNLMTRVLNNKFGNKNITFKYEILPVSLYNETEYLTNAFKLATSGYSFLLPAAVMGISQGSLLDLKKLEEDVMDLSNILVPLSSAYTQSVKGQQEQTEKRKVGRPQLGDDEVSDKTVANRESLERSGG